MPPGIIPSRRPLGSYQRTGHCNDSADHSDDATNITHIAFRKHGHTSAHAITCDASRDPTQDANPQRYLRRLP